MTAIETAVETVHLLELPHAQARALLATGATVTLCVNPVEYHGPHLSLQNDRLVSLGIARRLAARLATGGAPPVFVLAGDIEAGVEPASGPGSRHVPYRDVRRAVLESCRALAELGARRVVLMTFHGAPMHSHALESGVEWLVSHGIPAFAPLVLALEAMISGEVREFAPALAGIEDPAERATMLAGLADDFHAGFFETSVALELTPESVSPIHLRLPPCPSLERPRALVTLSRLMAMAGHKQLAGELRVAAAGLAWAALRPFPGYTCRPHRASAAAGAVFVREMLDRIEAVARGVFFGGAAPPPAPFRWMPALTLGGRMARPPVPLEAIQSFAIE